MYWRSLWLSLILPPSIGFIFLRRWSFFTSSILLCLPTLLLFFLWRLLLHFTFDTLVYGALSASWISNLQYFYPLWIFVIVHFLGVIYYHCVDHSPRPFIMGGGVTWYPSFFWINYFVAFLSVILLAVDLVIIGGAFVS